MPRAGFPLQALIAETGPVTERLRVREIDDDEGRRLVRIIRRGSGSVVTWRRAQMCCCPRRAWPCPRSPRWRSPAGRQWAAVSGENQEPGRAPRPRMRATYTRTAGIRHLFAACELGEDKLFGHIKPRKTRARFLEFCRYLRSLYPASIRIAIICDNFSPHLSTRKDRRVGTWAAANNVEIAYTPTNSSWLNRIEAQFTALRYFALDGTDHASHKEQASMIRRYIIWRNNHAYDERLRRIVAKANVA